MESLKENEVGENVRRILAEVEEEADKVSRDPAKIELMAVTKTVPAERVNEAIAAGICLLGENKAQELLGKYESYNKSDCKIHFIGHLQSNKVKQILPKVQMIESVDSLRLAEEIDQQAKRIGVRMPILLEVNIGREESKSGFLKEDLESHLSEIASLENLKLSGLMTIPPVCEKEAQIEEYFYQMYQLFIDIKRKKIDNISMDFLSMGMSQDYKAAVRQGSNLLRIGTAMFGKRDALRR